MTSKRTSKDLGLVDEQRNVSVFMESPLVQWVKTFRKSKENIDFEELIDSVFLLDVLLTVDEGSDNETITSINRTASMECHAKLCNWILLMKTLHRYYVQYLQQLVVFSWPDIFILVNDKNRGDCATEVEKFLLLLLGYAVQCDRKEDFIEIIKNLHVETQQALVSHIQQITEIPRNVLSLNDASSLETSMLCSIIRNLSEERLICAERLLKFNEDTYILRNGPSGTKLARTPATSFNSCQENLKTNETKKQIRILQEELDEKTKLLIDLKEELLASNSELSKKKSENAILTTEIKTTRIYKDELDSFKELALKAEKYQKEIVKYKEKLSDSEFYKVRLEELRKDNDLLFEAKTKMEVQITSSNKRIEKIMDELVLSQINLENNNSEKNELNKKLLALAEENSRLEYEKSQMNSGILAANIQRFMSITSIDCIPATDINQPTGGNSISDEVNETLTTHLTRLQIENDGLRMKLKEATDKFYDCERELMQLRKEEENEFQRKLDAMQHHTSEQRKETSRELSKEFEQRVLEIEQRSIQLKNRVSKEFQQKFSEMERQNKSLQLHIEELQRQIKFIEDTWSKDRDQCARFHNMNGDLLSERQQLKRGIALIHASCDEKLVNLQNKMEFIEKETKKLEKQGNKIYDLCDDAVATTTTAIRNPLDFNENQSLHDYSDLNSTYGIDSVQRRNKDENETPPSTTLTVRRSNTTIGGGTIPLEDGPHNKTPVRGVAVPLRRTSENARDAVAFSKHAQASPKTNNLQHLLRLKPVTFSRNDKSRHTMPDRITSQPHRYFSQSNPQSPLILPVRGNSQRSWLIGGQKINPSPGSSFDPSSLTDSCSSGQYDARSVRSSFHNESAFSDSRDVNQIKKHQNHGDVKNGEMVQTRGTRWQLSYSEKRVTQTSDGGGGGGGGLSLGDEENRCKALVDQIIELQGQNQQLVSNNVDLRRRLQTTNFLEEKVNTIEERNLQLEVENRKLKMILQTLQKSVPYDKRTYQYNSNV